MLLFLVSCSLNGCVLQHWMTSRESIRVFCSPANLVAHLVHVVSIDSSNNLGSLRHPSNMG